MNQPETVWLLTIDHRHGTDTFVHKTEDGAKATLVCYVEDWWSEQCGDLEIPDDDVAITAYFDAAGDEYYSLEERTVMP